MSSLPVYQTVRSLWSPQIQRLQTLPSLRGGAGGGEGLCSLLCSVVVPNGKTREAAVPPRREEDGVPPIDGNPPLLTCLRSRKMGAMTASASRCCWGDSPGLPRVKCTSHHAARTPCASAVRSPLDPASEL